MVFFIFIQILIEHLQAYSGDPDQTPRSVAPGLDMRYLPTSHKKDARLLWVKNDFSFKSADKAANNAVVV